MIEIDIRKSRANFTAHFAIKCMSRRIVLFGPSGSGKSTLLKMLTGLCLPDQGNITVNSKRIFAGDQGINVPVHLRRFGYLPQDYTLFPTMTIGENICYGLRVRKKKVEPHMLQRMGLKLGIADKLRCRPSELSGGQQQRAALARIMFITPRALLLDEPFSALDRKSRESLRDLVSELATDLNIPTVLVTHDLEDAHAFGQEIVIIKDGSAIEYGDRKTVLNRPEFVETARLLDFQVFSLGHSKGDGFHTPAGQYFNLGRTVEKDTEYICIKPENIMLLREDKSHSVNLPNRVSGTILRLHPRAAHTKITFRSLKDEEYIIHAPNHVLEVMNIHPGKKVHISLKQESLIPCARRNR